MSDSENRQQTDVITPFPSFSALRVAHSDLLQSNFEPDNIEQHLAEVKEFVDRAQSTGAFLSSDEERRSAQSMLNYWVTVLYRVENTPRKAVLVDYKPEMLPGLADDKPPYPGIRAFTEDESNIFFGRQRQIDYLFSRLKEDRMIAIVGPSGSGKSSLVLAGLLPALKKDEPNSGKRNYFPPTEPGSNPLANLALMIKGFDKEASDSGVDPIEGFKQDKQHLLKLIEKKSELPAVLIIENFEETFTLCKDKDLQQAYIDNLLSVIQTPNIRHTVILTMRSDSLFDFEMRKLPDFRRLLEPAKVLLPMLGASDLRDAIEKPAELVGVKFDEPVTQEFEVSSSSGRLKTRDSTVQALIKEVLSEPIGLPLLQFSLLKLWAKRKGNLIPDNPFPEINSYHEMLAIETEKLFNRLDPKQQRIASRILLPLFAIDNESKITTSLVLRKKLYRSSETREAIDSVLDKLVEAQVIRFTKSENPADQQVELIQPSLIRTWPRMRAWDEERKSKQRRFLGRLIATAAVLVVVMVYVLPGGRYHTPSENEKLSIALAKKSAGLWQNKRIDLALLLGLESYAISQNADSRLNLFTYLHSAPQPKEFLYQEGYDPDSVVFNSDSSLLASYETESRRVILWNVNARQAISEFSLPPDNNLNSLTAFSHDSKILASTNSHGAVSLWNVNSGHLITTLPDNTWGVAFSPDDKLLASGSTYNNVIFWDITTPGEPKTVYQHQEESDVNVTAFNLDGTMLAVGLDDGTITLLDTGLQKVIKTLKPPTPPTQKNQPTESASIYSVSFSPDNKLLATGRAKDAAIWDIETGQVIGKLTTDNDSQIFLISFSGDGKTVAGLSEDGTIVLWDAAAGKQIRRHFYQSINLGGRDGDFSFDNKTLASGIKNGIMLWDVVAPPPAIEFNKGIYCMAFSPDSKTLALGLSGTSNGEIILWNSSSNKQVDSLPFPNTGVLSVAFSHDGKTLAALLGNGTTIALCHLNASSQYQCNDPVQLQLKRGSSVSGVPALSFSKDDKYLLLFMSRTGPRNESGMNNESGASNESGMIHVLDHNNNLNEVKFITITATTPEEKRNTISSAAFSSDGETLAVGYVKGTIILYTISGLEFKQHSDSLKVQSESGLVRTLAFGSSALTHSKKPALIALAIDTSDASQESKPPIYGNIILGDAEANKEIAKLLTGRDVPISSLALSPDGKFLASASEDHTLILWSLDVESAPERFCKVVGRNLTKIEWCEYFEDESYHLTCEGKPPGEKAYIGLNCK